MRLCLSLAGWMAIGLVGCGVTRQMTGSDKKGSGSQLTGEGTDTSTETSDQTDADGKPIWCSAEQGNLSIAIQLKEVSDQKEVKPVVGWKIKDAKLSYNVMDDSEPPAFKDWGMLAAEQSGMNKAKNEPVTDAQGNAVLCFQVSPAPEEAGITLYHGETYTNYVSGKSAPTPAVSAKLVKDAVEMNMTGPSLPFADTAAHLRLVIWQAPCMFDAAVRDKEDCSKAQEKVSDWNRNTPNL